MVLNIFLKIVFIMVLTPSQLEDPMVMLIYGWVLNSFLVYILGFISTDSIGLGWF